MNVSAQQGPPLYFKRLVHLGHREMNRLSTITLSFMYLGFDFIALQYKDPNSLHSFPGQIKI